MEHPRDHHDHARHLASDRHSARDLDLDHDRDRDPFIVSRSNRIIATTLSLFRQKTAQRCARGSTNAATPPPPATATPIPTTTTTATATATAIPLLYQCPTESQRQRFRYFVKKLSRCARDGPPTRRPRPRQRPRPRPRPRPRQRPQPRPRPRSLHCVKVQQNHSDNAFATALKNCADVREMEHA